MYGFRRRVGSATGWVVLALAAVSLSACTPFVSVTRVSPEAVGQELAASALTGDRLSTPTRNVLLEHGLLEARDKDPAATLARLHQAMVAEDGDHDDLFALAELSFREAQRARDITRYLCAAVYAYAFLFAEGYGESPSRFDPRLRMAADLYNRALTLALANPDGSEVTPRTGRFALPFGVLDIDMDPAALKVGAYTLDRFTPVADLEVSGLAMRYRRAGLGAPLAASLKPQDPGIDVKDFLPPEMQLPVTLLLRIPDLRRALVHGGVLAGKLDVFLAAEPERITIGGESVPLEVEPTAALAVALSQLSVLEREITHFVGLTPPGRKVETLATTASYRRGLIPVVFVHGTFSSAVRWAEMVNRLEADPLIRRGYQFWFYAYDSSNPVAYSALQLRRLLTTAVTRLDPVGVDPALARMVLIGHSQGGLLVKMLTVDSGDALWNRMSHVPLRDLRISAASRETLREGLFVTPFPGVRRVIFISTPHRGSFVAGRQLVAALVRRLVRAPADLATLGADMALHPELMAGRGFVLPTAVDNMSPRSSFLQALADLPVAAGIHTHSIISVDGDGPPEKGNDGVVEYASAHIEGVDSELVVRSPHSTQGTPATIEEVRRILRLHLAEP
jgi:pimeloyl-ACP methyl ester carboxylesterase